VKSWYPVQGWVGVDSADHSIVLVPLDAPLVHLGGVNTGRIVEHLDQTNPVVMSWALNNHWFVNFKAAQDGRIRLCYSLTSMAGPLDIETAMRFSTEVRTPPVVLRDRKPITPASGAVLEVLEGEEVIVGSKVSEDSSGVVLRLLNTTRQPKRVTLDLGRPLRGAWLVHPDERPMEELGTGTSRVSTAVGPRSSRSLLLKW
jgi:hypothetical protein